MSSVLLRSLTILAIAVLAFDGVALAVLGVLTDRLLLVFIGAAFFVSSGLIIMYWRWYRRRVADIAAARAALGNQVREMQRLVRRSEK